MPRKKMMRPDDPAAALQQQYPLPPGCQVRYFQEGDEEAMLECLQRSYGAWPHIEISVPPIDHLRWKLRMHETALRSHIVAVLDGKFIVVRPLWAMYVKVDDGLLLGRQAIDRAVVKEFQQQGVMTAMEVRMPASWHERFDLTFSLRVNWQRINLTPGHNYIRPIDVVARVLDSPAPPLDASIDWTLREVETFDERFDALWAEASRPFRVIVARTKEHLNYRYADKRAGNYRVVAAQREGRVLGYVVTTGRQDVGYVADAFVLPGRNDVLESLLIDAIEHLRRAGRTSLECWRFPYHPYIPALQKVGIDVPKRTEGVNFRSLNGLDSEYAFFEDVKQPAHFMPGDSDIV